MKIGARPLFGMRPRSLRGDRERLLRTAQIDSKKLPAAKKAAASFAERAKGSEKTGEVPGVTDPAIASRGDSSLPTG
jgi:hypothetical protein